MALAEAILVCLAEKPLSGYELAKSFDSSIGFFWRSFSSIVSWWLYHSVCGNLRHCYFARTRCWLGA